MNLKWSTDSAHLIGKTIAIFVIYLILLWQDYLHFATIDNKLHQFTLFI